MREVSLTENPIGEVDRLLYISRMSLSAKKTGSTKSAFWYRPRTSHR